jgi:hypothetical protein
VNIKLLLKLCEGEKPEVPLKPLWLALKDPVAENKGVLEKVPEVLNTF